MLPEDYILLRFMLTIHRVSALWSFGQNAGDLKNEKNIGLVIIDYLQLMTASVKDSANREQEIATISRGLKGLAKELDVPVIALAQLSRAVEQRGRDKRPQLSDLRESGSIEQDADVVCFLYRPEYYGITTTDEGESTHGIAEVIVGKQRNGPTGTVALHFVKEYARFENLTSASYTTDYVPKDFGSDVYMPDDAESYGESKSGSRGANPAKGLGPIIDDESPFLAAVEAYFFRFTYYPIKKLIKFQDMLRPVKVGIDIS